MWRMCDRCGNIYTRKYRCSIYTVTSYILINYIYGPYILIQCIYGTDCIYGVVYTDTLYIRTVYTDVLYIRYRLYILIQYIHANMWRMCDRFVPCYRIYRIYWSQVFTEYSRQLY